MDVDPGTNWTKPEIMLKAQGRHATSLNKNLPVEIIGLIFEEHAALEWKAPTVGGRVCRLWRQIMLNTPRAWGYLEIYETCCPSISQLWVWLSRSGSMPLHIRVEHTFKSTNLHALYDQLANHHTRITSLRMREGVLSFFEGREFPRMQVLDIKEWHPMGPSALRIGPMPQLQSLRLGATDTSVEPFDGLARLKRLALHKTSCTHPLRHTQSLTTLMLQDICFKNAVSGPVTFPSLTYLSLFGAPGLKSHIIAPCLTTYHECSLGIEPREVFPVPLPSVVEYGVSGSDLHPIEWHYSFPNVQRLSMRSHPGNLMEVLYTLSYGEQLLPALQLISVKQSFPLPFTQQEQRIMGGFVEIRSEGYNTDLALYIENSDPGQATHIPLFSGCVSQFSSSGDFWFPNTDNRTRNILCEYRRVPSVPR